MKVAVHLSLVPILIVTASAQVPSRAKPYNVDEAYRVYIVLLPKEESYGFSGKGKIVIQRETVSHFMGHADVDGCISNKVKLRFQEAIDDFVRVNKQTWLLQPRFETKPYELVSAEQISSYSKTEPKKDVKPNDGWKAFYDHHPGSGGYHIMSAVGFNKDKTKAIVYSGSSCGSLCGSWSLHLLEKTDGKWREVPGVVCRTVS